MQWRFLARRSIGKSMTIVGDPQQANHRIDGDWVDNIARGLEVERCATETLSVNYRTPAALMGPARLLRSAFAGSEAHDETVYVRDGITPIASRTPVLTIDDIERAVTQAQGGLNGRGRLAVIAPTDHLALATAAISGIDGAGDGRSVARLDRQVAVYSANEVKGLEFDAVVLLDPSAIAGEFGWRQLYVALTRATAHLGIVMVGELDEYESAWIEAGALELVSPK
jgi:DNA helicase IV